MKPLVSQPTRRARRLCNRARRSFPIAKNPFMSAYLSAANRVANTARGHATNEFKRQSKRQTTSMVNAWVDAWTPKPKARAKPARKRKSS